MNSPCCWLDVLMHVLSLYCSTASCKNTEYCSSRWIYIYIHYTYLYTFQQNIIYVFLIFLVYGKPRDHPICISQGAQIFLQYWLATGMMQKNLHRKLCLFLFEKSYGYKLVMKDSEIILYLKNLNGIFSNDFLIFF